MLADLAAQGLLAHEPRRLVALPALAARWVAAYPVLRQRLNPRRYRWLDPAKPASWRELPLGSLGAWSGEAAAQLLLGEVGVQPARLLLYSAEDRENLCARLGLTPHLHGTVELLRPFTSAASLLLSAACVHPLVVFADLQLAETAPATQLTQRLAQRYLPDLIAAPSA